MTNTPTGRVYISNLDYQHGKRQSGLNKDGGLEDWTWAIARLETVEREKRKKIEERERERRERGRKE